MYPRVVVDLNKIEHNTKVVADKCKDNGIEIMGVTKVFCAYPEIAAAEVRGGVKILADSRIENLMKLEDLDAPKLLLRLPMKSQAVDVVKWADISLNSEIETIKALSFAAVEQGKKHKVVLMVDLGDLREGILPTDVETTVEEILKLEGVVLHGVGVNLTCYGGVMPNKDNLGQLMGIAEKIEKKYEIKLEMISGGNSSSFYLIDKGELPKGINNLRMGEIIVLGRETAFGDLVENMHDDAFILEAEIIELKEKPTMPIGERGMDAFGNKPVFEDKGIRKRAILAIGRQDVNPDSITPIDEKIGAFGASSDHLIIDVTDCEKEYKVGDIVSFKLDYGSLLNVFTSEYIDKFYL